MKISGACYRSNESDVCIIGIPYKLDPVNSIKKIFNNFEGYNLKESTDVFAKNKICDYGSIGNSIKTIEKNLHKITNQKKFFVFIGGDHFISFPIIKNSYKSDDVGIIWLDAHADLRDRHPGTFNVKNSNVTALRRIHESFPKKEIIIIGLRSCSEEEKEFYKKKNIKVIKSWEINLNEIKNLIKNKKWYMSIDIDILDPIYAPGVDYPEPFGISLEKLNEILKIIFKNSEVIGADIVEVKKERITLINAAKVLEMLLLENFKFRKHNYY